MRRFFWAIVIIIIGFWIWLSHLGYLQFSRDWPLIIILWGIWVLVKAIRKAHCGRVKIVVGSEYKSTEGEGKFLKIHVTDKNTGKVKVNIRFPIGIVKLGTDFIPADARVKINEENIDINKIIEAIDKKMIGKIIEVEKDDRKVEVYIEE